MKNKNKGIIIKDNGGKEIKKIFIIIKISKLLKIIILQNYIKTFFN